MDTKGGKPWWGGGGGGVMNWAIWIDMYTLMCIKLMTNKNLLYKKVNIIKFKNSKKEKQKIIQTINAGEGVEKREPFYTVGGNVNWYSRYGEEYGGSLIN